MRIKNNIPALYMLRAGISNQKQLAERAGLSQNTVSALMRGATGKPESIGKLANALGVDPAVIIEEEIQ